MPKQQKYESQLHLGLMAIIIVLLLLCMASNYVLYRQRGIERGRVEKSLQDYVSAAAKQLNIRGGDIPSISQIEFTRQKLNLSNLSVMPFVLNADSGREWWSEIAKGRLASKGIEGAISLSFLAGKVGEILPGDSAEFLLLSEVASENGRILVMAGAEFPEYRMLIRASDVLFYASLAGLLVLGILYSTVTRVITAPFERLKHNARRAGRVDLNEVTDIEAIINDYEKLVGELRESESELKELSRIHQEKADTLEHFSRYLLKSLVSGVITLDRSGSILAINQTAGNLLALPGEDWVGKNMTDLPRYCDPIIDLVMVSSQMGKNEPYQEIVIVPSEAQSSTIGTTVSVVFDADGSCIGFSILLNDLSEISRLRTELQRREQLAALGEMAGGLAHQLRNALGSAKGYSRLIEKKIRSGADCGDNLERLGAELQQTEQLVSRFLDFARPLNVLAEMIDIGALMEEIVRSFAVREDCRAVRIDLERGKVPDVFADALLLKQALTNVIENGIKSYQGKSGRVAVAVKSNVSAVIIEISDTGDGITENNLPKVFMPFFTTRTDGTGLGLPLAKKIIDRHDGTLSITSKPGLGTTVQIVLPLAGAPLRTTSAIVAV